MKDKIIIGTRGSKLALVQTHTVRDALLELYPDLEIEVKVIKTKGDRFLQLALDASGDKGLFTKELEAELLSSSIDLAVHSLKDLPVEPVAGTCIAAILPRERTEDVLLGDYTLDTLPEHAVVGTSSRRRGYQLRKLYPQLNIRPIRGNVETRIAKMKAGEYNAIVMAHAGLLRLDLQNEISQVINEEIIVPAPGQAAIAVHTRTDDTSLHKLLAPLHHPQTALEVGIERRLLSSLGGGCALPLGCVCHIEADQAHLKAFYANESGERNLYLERHFSIADTDEVIEDLCTTLTQLHS